MPPDRVRNHLQINHLVRLLRRDLEGVRTVLDAGCGRSYVTLLLAHLGWEVRGIDRDPARIAECRRRAEVAGLDVRYEVGDIATSSVRADAVVALHACDTATCDAIAVGVAMDARVIAVAPCCQAELARKWADAPRGSFAPVHRAGHLRRELAAHVTDAMRMLLLRAAGYAVTAEELVEAGHSPKNTLLRAVRAEPDPAARAEYDDLVATTGGAGLALAGRL
jgi:SAM-dependent methyltransferase